MHVREKIIDRRLKVANQLNAKFLEHLGEVQNRELEKPDQKEPELNIGFVEISHEGDPGILVDSSAFKPNFKEKYALNPLLCVQP